MTTKLRSALQFVLLIYCATTLAVAQQSAAADKPEPPKTGSIKGRVTGEDGQPLANVQVMAIPLGARNAAARRQGQPVMPAQAATDDEGNFEFTNLAPASYAITASVPGYVAPLPEDPEGEKEENRTGVYRFGDFANIALVKGGVITGKVVSSKGDPLTGVNVSAIRIGNLNGEPDELSAARGFGRNWRTDDRGVYRIYGLMPGTYIVQAGQIGRPGGGGTPSPYSEDAPTYFPSSARDAAIALAVRAGDEMPGIDIRYRAEKGRSVGGKVMIAKTTDNNDFGSTEIRLSLAGTDSVLATTIQAGQVGRSQNSGFAFYGIPDGEYEIAARRNGTGGESDSVSESRRVTVRGVDVVGIQLTLTPLALLGGRVLIEKAAANSAASCPSPRQSFTAEILLTAQRDEAITGPTANSTSNSTMGNRRSNLFRSTAPAATGEYLFRNLEAGRWRLLAQLPDENWYLRSISSASLNNGAAVVAAARRPPQPAAAAALPTIARNGASLKTGEKLTGITITIAEGAAALKGNLVNQQGKSSARLQIHLIPAEKESGDDVLRYAQTNSSGEGAFHFKNLTPGRYFLLAKPVKEASAGAPLRLLSWEAAQRAALRKEAEAAGNVVELADCQRVADHKLNINGGAK